MLRDMREARTDKALHEFKQYLDKTITLPDIGVITQSILSEVDTRLSERAIQPYDEILEGLDRFIKWTRPSAKDGKGVRKRALAFECIVQLAFDEEHSEIHNYLDSLTTKVESSTKKLHDLIKDAYRSIEIRIDPNPVMDNKRYFMRTGRLIVPSGPEEDSKYFLYRIEEAIDENDNGLYLHRQDGSGFNSVDEARRHPFMNPGKLITSTGLVKNDLGFPLRETVELIVERKYLEGIQTGPQH